MAHRTWCRSLLVALGMSVLAVAGQLGVAYGLGILRLDRSFTDGAVNQWPAQLSWVTWYGVLAAVTGAAFGDRHARREGLPVTTPVQLSLALAATLGATVLAPLATQPAREAQVASIDPVQAVVLHGLAGALVGLVAAVVALRWAPAVWNLAAFSASLWLLGLLSVVPSLGAAEALPVVRFGALEPAMLAPDAAQRLAMLGMPGLALVVGATVAGVARWQGQPALVGAASAVAGPLLAATAYLVAGPGSDADRYQAAPYWAALLSIATGALGGAAATGLPVVRDSRDSRDQPPTPSRGWASPRGDGSGPEIAPPTPSWSMPSRRPAGADTARTLVVDAASDATRWLRGLLRRGRRWIGRSGSPHAAHAGSTNGADDRPVPAPDEEYVDWVTGLGEPAPDGHDEPGIHQHSRGSG